MLKLSFERNDSFDLLTTEFNKNQAQIHEGAVIDVAQQLDQLIEQYQMRGRLLKINGNCPIPFCYTIAIKISSLYAAFA
jgi:hypothetical protein